MSKTTFIVNGVDVLEENAKLKKENEILQTSLEMIKNTEGQAHIKAIELTKKLEKIKKVILRCKEANCTNCEYQAKCNFNGDDFDDFLLRIIEGAEDE